LQARAALRTSRLRLARTLRIARLKGSLLDRDSGSIAPGSAHSTAASLGEAASAALAQKERAALLAAGDAAGEYYDSRGADLASAAVPGAAEEGESGVDTRASRRARSRSGTVRQRWRGGEGEASGSGGALAFGAGSQSRFLRSSSDPEAAAQPGGAPGANQGGQELILVDPRMELLPAAEGAAHEESSRAVAVTAGAAAAAPPRAPSAPELAGAALKAEPPGAEAAAGPPGGWGAATARALLGHTAGVCYVALALAFVTDLSLLTLVYPATMLLVPLLAQRTCAAYWRVRQLAQSSWVFAARLGRTCTALPAHWRGLLPLHACLPVCLYFPAAGGGSTSKACSALPHNLCRLTRSCLCTQRSF
jgi:hypothetical protein